jgi:hypothetical protein
MRARLAHGLVRDRGREHARVIAAPESPIG